MKAIAAVLGLGIAGAICGFHGALPLAIIVALGIGAVMAALLAVRLALVVAGIAILLAFFHYAAGHSTAAQRTEYRQTSQ